MEDTQMTDVKLGFFDDGDGVCFVRGIWPSFKEGEARLRAQSRYWKQLFEVLEFAEGFAFPGYGGYGDEGHGAAEDDGGYYAEESGHGA